MVSFAVLALAQSSHAAGQVHLRARFHDLAFRGHHHAALSLADTLLARAGKDSAMVAFALRQRVRCLLALGGERSAVALESARRALAASRSRPGRDSIDFGRTLVSLGSVLSSRERIAEARAALTHGLRIVARARPRSPLDEAEALEQLAMLESRARHREQGFEIGLRALESWKAAGSPFEFACLAWTGWLSAECRANGDSGRARTFDLEIAFACASALALDSLDERVIEPAIGLAQRSGDPARAESLAWRGVALLERGLGKDHPDAIGALERVANMIRAGGRELRRAYPHHMSVLEKRLRAPNPMPLELMFAYRSLAQVEADIGMLDSALVHSERELEIAEATADIGPLEVGVALWTLGFVHERLGNFEKRAELWKRIVGIRTREYGPDHFQVGLAHRQLGWSLFSAGDYLAAEEHERHAIRIIERALGTDVIELTPPLLDLGASLRSRGDYAAAEAYMKRSLSIAEALQNEAQVAQSLINLGHNYREMADYAAARAAYQRVVEMREKMLGSDHARVTEALRNLAWTCYQSGDVAEAVRHAERVVELAPRVRGGGRNEMPWALWTLGSFMSRVDPARAESLLWRAIRENKDPAGSGAVAKADCLTSLAFISWRQGRAAVAESLLREIDPSKIGGRKHSLLLNNLGVLAAERGDTATAGAHFRQARTLSAERFGPRHLSRATYSLGYAELSLQEGMVEEGLELALEAEQIGVESLSLLAQTVSERQAIVYAFNRPSGLGHALTIAANERSSRIVRRCWNALIRSRSLVLDEVASRRSRSADSSREANDLARAVDRLSGLMVRGPRGDLPWFEREILEAQRQKEAAEAALVSVNLGYQATRERGRIDLDRISAALPERSALVAYTRYDRRLPPAASRWPESTRWKAPSAPAPYRWQWGKTRPCYLAFVLVPQSDPIAIDLGEAAVIDSLAESWIRHASRETAVAEVARETRCRQAGDALRRAVWDPLARHLGQPERVLLVPDASLQLVSFAALPLRDGRYMVEDHYLIQVLASERDVVPRTETLRAGQGLLAVGGVDFERKDELLASAVPPPAPPQEPSDEGASRGLGFKCRDLMTTRWRSLDATLDECREVEAAFASHQGGSGPNVLLTGPGASEALVKRHAPGKRIVHLATHGFVMNALCDRAPNTASDDVPVDEPFPGKLGNESPLVLAGLVLAGANRHVEGVDPADDGFLTAEEVTRLDLRGVDWVVLSACGTGLGVARDGEGVFGLRRAFHIAGVKTLIMTLWSVNDEATRSWMRALYESRFTNGANTAEAVRAASRAVLAERRRAGLTTHPFHWGAFVAAGDWR